MLTLLKMCANVTKFFQDESLDAIKAGYKKKKASRKKKKGKKKAKGGRNSDSEDDAADEEVADDEASENSPPLPQPSDMLEDALLGSAVTPSDVTVQPSSVLSRRR